MALASDMRVMGRRSFFSFLFPQVGLSGADMGASYLLPRVVGLGLASEILMLGERVSAERCQQIGLANAVVDDENPGRSGHFQSFDCIVGVWTRIVDV